jgi:hypothetical protein
MTWEILEEKHGIVPRGGTVLFEGCAPVEPTPVLVEYLRRGRRSRLANEWAKAYRLVDPVIAELEVLRAGKISSIPEMDLEIKDFEGLCGTPDFVISADPSFKVVPIIAIVEAKKDDMDAGLPQCAAELYAAYLLNKGRPGKLYGSVTIGTEWRFMCFHGDSRKVAVDDDIYFIIEPAKLLGVLCHIVDVSLAALAALDERR